MKYLLLVLIFVSLCFATSEAPSNSLEDANYQYMLVDSAHHDKEILWIYSLSGLDTLTGDDSVKIFNRFGPETGQGWEYILTNNALSGDSAAVSKLELILQAVDENDTIISHTNVDTLTYTGGSIKIPFGDKHGYFGQYYNAWLRVPGSSGEILVRGLWLWQRRPRQTQTIRN